MIAEKLRMIKSKSTEPSPVLSTALTNSAIPPSPHEISQITARLNQIRPQIPQIDKLLLLHSKLPHPPSSTLDLVKKLTDCRNLLVGQVENISQELGKRLKGFLMNLGQLNLLIEQVQRLFNSLVSKMKESAGVNGLKTVNNCTVNNVSNGNVNNISNGTSVHNTAITATNNINSSNSNNLLNSASSTSSLSSNPANSANSSASSLTKFKVKPAITTNSQSSSNDKYEKLLIQRLSLPPDLSASFNNSSDSYIYNSAILRSRKNPKLKLTNQKHLKQRNILLSKEIQNLRFLSKYKTRIQDDGLGVICLHVASIQCQYIFRISQKYPFDELVYRIELNNNEKFVLLPKHLEPKTFPISITNIIRNYESTFDT